jgi:multidrug efflux pump subunit AcrB
LVTVQLAKGADADAAMVSLRAELQRAMSQLPANAMLPTVSRGRGVLVARYAIRSDALPLVQLHEVLRTTWLARVEATAGVGAVVTCGDAVPRVTVNVDSAALAGMGRTVGDVVAALTPLPGARSATAEALASVLIATVNGAPIRIRDVARVSDDAALGRCRAFGDRGALFEASVYAQPSADVREVRAALAQSLTAAMRELPPGVDLRELGAGHAVAVDLDPAVSLAGAVTALRDAVTTAAGGAPFVVEIETEDPGATRDPSPEGARVVLDTADDGAVQRMVRALAMVPVLRGAGEPNATVLLVGPDRAALGAAAPDLVKRLAERSVVVARRGNADRPTPVFRNDRAAAAQLGVSIPDASLAIQALRGGATVAGVLVRIDGTLDRVYVRAGTATAPLSAIVTMSVERAPAVLLRDDQFPAVGARVHAADLASLEHVFEPPAGIILRVVPEP